MGSAASRLAMTVSDFLAWDATQSIRHEFVDGEVFAMAGAEDRHVTVSLNLALALRQQLAGTRCRVYINDMKLHVAASQSYFYPDVMVTCSAADLATPSVKTAACLIVEVLSPSTAAYDRGAKFAHYRRIPDLMEYVLVDIDTRTVDVHRKNDQGLWVLHPFDAGQTVQLASMDMSIAAEQVFADVEPDVRD